MEEKSYKTNTFSSDFICHCSAGTRIKIPIDTDNAHPFIPNERTCHFLFVSSFRSQTFLFFCFRFGVLCRFLSLSYTFLHLRTVLRYLCHILFPYWNFFPPLPSSFIRFCSVRCIFVCFCLLLFRATTMKLKLMKPFLCFIFILIPLLYWNFLFFSCCCCCFLFCSFLFSFPFCSFPFSICFHFCHSWLLLHLLSFLFLVFTFYYFVDISSRYHSW